MSRPCQKKGDDLGRVQQQLAEGQLFYLRLALSENPVEPIFDATDAEGETYQIKSRIVEDLSEPTSFDFRDIDARFDYFVGVVFDPALEVLEMVLVPYEVVKELGSHTT